MLVEAFSASLYFMRSEMRNTVSYAISVLFYLDCLVAPLHAMTGFINNVLLIAISIAENAIREFSLNSNHFVWLWRQVI